MRTSLVLEKITSRLYKNLGVLIMLVGIIYNSLSVFGLIYCTKFSLVSTVVACLVTSLCSFIAVNYKIMRAPTVVLYFFVISIVSISPYIKLHLFYLIPFILIIHSYKLNKISIPFLVISAIVYAFAVGYREYLHLIEVTTKPFDFVIVGFSTGFMFLVEILITYWLFYPIINILIEAKETNNKFEDKLEQSSIDILKFCSTAMSYHNKYLSVHIKGVEAITVIILNELKKLPFYEDVLTDEYCEQIRFSVQFHDIGKIYIDSTLLDKCGSLSEDEIELLKKHPIKGVELFNLLPESALPKRLRQVCENVIIQHHEKLDGSGYPYGLKGGEITIEGQIVAVADITDALLSWRPYKDAFDWDHAIEAMEEMSDKLNRDCYKAVLKNKEEIIKISSANNEELKKIFNL